MPSGGGARIKEIEMPSPSLAFEASTYADRPIDEASPPYSRTAIELAHDAEYCDLLREIRAHEGEIVENPPLLFKLTITVGCAMTAAGIVGLGLVLHRVAVWPF